MGSQYQKFDVTIVEKHYNAKYVGDFCVRAKNGGWTEHPISIFWQEQPPKPDMSHYFGIYRHDGGGIMITSGESVAEGTWNGCVAKNGEIIFSRWRHDYRTSSDGTACVDGGRDYFKGYGNPVSLKLKNGRMVIVNEEVEEEKQANASE